MNIESIAEGLEKIKPSDIQPGDLLLLVFTKDRVIAINQVYADRESYFDTVDNVFYLECDDYTFDLRGTSVYLIDRPLREEPKEIGSTVWFESEGNKFVLLKTAETSSSKGFWTVFRYRSVSNIVPSFWNNNPWTTWGNISNNKLYNYEWGQQL